MWGGLSTKLKTTTNKVSPESLQYQHENSKEVEIPTVRKVTIEEPTPTATKFSEKFKDIHFLCDDDTGIEGDEKIVLNIGGQRHETLRSTILKYPRTLLYRVVSDPRIHQSVEVFIDHHPDFFPAILLYYRTGELHIPKDVCTPLVAAELQFWGIDENEIEPCCWVTYNHYHETQNALEQFEADVDEFEDPNEPEDDEEEEALSPYEKRKKQLWIFLLEPSSSTAAKIWAILILCFVVISIAIFCLETHPYFKRTGIYAVSNATFTEVDLLIESLTLRTNNIPMTCLVCLDQTINAIFLFEYVAKFVTAPSKSDFALSLFSIIEILCLVPYYVGLIISFCHPNPNEIINLLNILFFTKSIRILRIFLLMKHFKALKILVYTLKASTKELLLLVLILVIAVVIFACLIYYAEHGIASGNKHMFTDIPTSFWWALVTITTVGYGDHVPNSWAGYIVGAFCSTSGVLIIALTVPIIVSNFSLYYTYAESTSKLRERKKQKAAESRRRSLMAKTQLLGIGARMAAQMMSKKSPLDTDKEKGNLPDSPSRTVPEDKQRLNDNAEDLVEEEMRRTLGSTITIAPNTATMGHGGSPIRSAVTYEKKTVNYFQVQREKINISLHDMNGDC